MTHLYIEQNTGLTEEVNASIIAKLYELASSGDLDNTSDLKGRLHSSAGRDVHIDYLNNNFSDLYVSTDNVYITFADPEVDRVLSNWWGDGSGVTNSLMSAKTVLDFRGADGTTGRIPFVNNTSVRTFNELGRFTTIKTIASQVFENASLESIDLSNIEYIGWQSFYSTNLSGTINLPSIKRLGNGTGNQQGSCFKSCQEITNVICGPNLELLGYGVFEYCAGLLTVTGLSNITNIPPRSFYQCSLLTSVDFDWSKITSIGISAFSGCTNLTFNLPPFNSLTLESWAFYNCKGLTSINLPSNNPIGDGVFSGCSNLLTLFDTNSNNASILFSNYGTSSFLNCTSLVFPQTITVSTSTTISNSNKNVLRSCFIGCTFHNVILDSSIKNISANAFENSHIESIDALYVLYITLYCFKGADVAEIILPSLIGFIDDYEVHAFGMFSNCLNLEKVVLGHITTIVGVNKDSPSRAWFYLSNKMKTLDVGDSVTQITVNHVGSIFNQDGSPAMREYIIRNTTVPTLSFDMSADRLTAGIIMKSFGGTQSKIYVPDSVLNDYKTANNWSIIASYIYPLSDIEPTT